MEDLMSDTKNNFLLKHFTAKEIKPRGWLLRQLRIQAEGLDGNLDKIWPDVKDSKWIGGDREGWERVPYWLDGFIPLAYLLDDEDMKSRARKYIDAILLRQKEDGWICPCEDEERIGYDVWAVFLICKVLVVYYECTCDERVEPAVRAALFNLNEWLRRHTLFNWGAARWFECMIPIGWLYDRRPEEWMLELSHSLVVQGMNYKLLADNFSDIEFNRDWKFTTHVVNLAMALKAYAVADRFAKTGNDDFAEEFLALLQKYHGTAFGLFTGDECLAGTSPTQGTELCAIVEAMYSFEILFEKTGKQIWLDRLEKLAFNALPATISEDMWTHQYDQQVNQISCAIQDRERLPIYSTNNHEANLFGLEPNFGCCTANMGQGFPKFALSAFYKGEDSIYVGAIAPVGLKTLIDGVAVEIECKTDYPFEDTVRYIVRCEKPVEFSLFLRVPGTASSALIDGKVAAVGGFTGLRRVWSSDTVEMTLQMEASLKKRPNGLFTAERGNLLFSLPVSFETVKHEYTKDGVERRFPYCDYELLPVSGWNYGFASGQLKCEKRPVSESPFSISEPAVILNAEMSEVQWELRKDYPGVCKEFPEQDGTVGKPESKRLFPYGCTKLRMTEMPLVGEEKP